MASVYSMEHWQNGIMRHTLKAPVRFDGIGVHGNEPVSVTMLPAPAQTGIEFLRTDIADPSKARIPVDIRLVGTGAYCTELTNEAGVSVRTIEHALAALMAARIDDAVIEINAREMPILDGSALPFFEAIDKAGRADLNVPRRYIKLVKPIEITDGDSFVRLSPADRFLIEAEIDFDHLLVGRQSFLFEDDTMDFHHLIAPARTFGFYRDAEALRKRGFALGASLDNTIVLTQSGMMNTSGLRFSDECVRHKILDIYGDFALLGQPFLGAVQARRGGHRINHLAIQALMDDESAWIVTGVDSRSSVA